MPILKNIAANGAENVTVMVFNEGVGLYAHSKVRNGRVHIAIAEENKEDPGAPLEAFHTDVIMDFYDRKGLRSFIDYLEKVHEKAEKHEKTQKNGEKTD